MASDNQDMAVATIVSALVAKGFGQDTDGCDLRFADGGVQLVDAEGRAIALEALIALVKRSLA